MHAVFDNCVEQVVVSLIHRHFTCSAMFHGNISISYIYTSADSFSCVYYKRNKNGNYMIKYVHKTSWTFSFGLKHIGLQYALGIANFDITIHCLIEYYFNIQANIM